MPVCCEWMWIFKIGIHVCYHDQTFSNLVFSWILLLGSLGVYSPRTLLQVLLILFSCYLSIQHFLCVLSFFIFTPKLFGFFLPSVVDLSLRTPHLPVNWILFRYFGMSCLILSNYQPFKSSFFRQHLLIYFFHLCSQIWRRMSFRCLFFSLLVVLRVV